MAQPRRAAAPAIGRRVHDFYQARGFRFPGEPGSAPPLLAQHDWVHVLGDFGTTVECELEVFGFIARASHDPQAFALLAMAILLFQTGTLASAAGIFEADAGHLCATGMPPASPTPCVVARSAATGSTSSSSTGSPSPSTRSRTCDATSGSPRERRGARRRFRRSVGARRPQPVPAGCRATPRRGAGPFLREPRRRWILSATCAAAGGVQWPTRTSPVTGTYQLGVGSTAAEVAAIVATTIAVTASVPQLRRVIIVTGDVAGVSMSCATLGVTTEVAWIVYAVHAGLWSALPEALAMSMANVAMAIGLVRSGAVYVRALVATATWAAVMVVVALLCGMAGVGVALGLSYVVQAGPSVWTAYRTYAPSGRRCADVGDGRGRGRALGVFGAATVTVAVISFAVTASLASAILVRTFTTRHRVAATARPDGGCSRRGDRQAVDNPVPAHDGPVMRPPLAPASAER